MTTMTILLLLAVIAAMVFLTIIVERRKTARVPVRINNKTIVRRRRR